MAERIGACSRTPASYAPVRRSTIGVALSSADICVRENVCRNARDHVACCSYTGTSKSVRRQAPSHRTQGRQGAASKFTTDFFSKSSWSECGASEEIISALDALGISRPSHIQAAAYGALAGGSRQFILADAAGSGKTLAYLLPLVQGILEEEKNLGIRTEPSCPRVVVICPTEELCAQVLLNCRALSMTVKFKSRAFTGGHKMTPQRDMLREGVDVAVCTPGRLCQLHAAGHLRFDACVAAVLDEVDVLLGELNGFVQEVMPLVHGLDESTTRLVLVSATLPEPVYGKLAAVWPGLHAVIGPAMHQVSTGVTEQLVDCSGGTDMTLEGGTKRKLAGLLAVLQRHNVPRTMVFCNKIEICRAVENFLIRQDRRQERLEVIPYHAAISDAQRAGNLESFLVPPVEHETRKVLVCTDRASRGIDTAYVEHVVLFEFPRDPSEYVRRVGRTARGAAGSGVVSVLVQGKQVQLARDIINRNQAGRPVHAVPLNSVASSALPPPSAVVS